MSASTTVVSFDADQMLRDGETPLGTVLARAKSLAEGEALELRASFPPLPLVDKAKQAGFQVSLASRGPTHILHIGAKPS